MTIGELGRLAESKLRVMKNEDRKKASYDYILADLIGRSIGRLYSKSQEYPAISEIYPKLFESEEIEDKAQEQKDKLSAVRFKQFANSFNNKMKKEGK